MQGNVEQLFRQVHGTMDDAVLADTYQRMMARCVKVNDQRFNALLRIDTRRDWIERACRSTGDHDGRS